MEREELKKVIEGVLIVQISEVSEAPAKLDEGDHLVDNLGLESADGIYFTFALSDALGIEIEDNDQNPFFDMDKGRDRTFGELVDWALPLVQVGVGHE